MEHIKKLIGWIEKHILEIPLPEHELHKVINISSSKLEKDFKKYTGIKLREYLLQRKIKSMMELKRRSLEMNHLDIMCKAHYHYSERTFRNHLKKYGKEKNASSFNDLEENFFHNASVFTEVLVRFILFNRLAKPKWKEGHISITHKVKNTIFQFNNLLPIESYHFYQIYLRLPTLSLSFTDLAIQRSTHPLYLYSPRKLSQYFSYLYTLNKQLEKHLNYSLWKAIKKGSEYVDDIKKISFETDSYWIELKDMHALPPLEINKRSRFIQATNSLISDIKEKLLASYRKRFLKLFGVSLESLMQYATYVRKADYRGMKNVLTKVSTWGDNKVVDLFFELTDCPVLDEYLVYGMGSKFDGVTAAELYNCSKEKCIFYMIEYKKAREKMTEESYEDFDFDEWFLQYL